VPTVVEFAREEKVAAVLTTSSGKAIKTVSAVAEALRLRGPSAMAVDNTLDKLNLKRALTKAGIPTPDYGMVEAELILIGPLLLKARGGIGGEGIHYVEDPQKMPVINNETYFWEKYITGECISLYGLVTTDVCFCFLALRKIRQPPSFVTKELQYLPLKAEYEQMFSQTITSLGINFGPVCQIDLISYDGKLYVIDAGIELDPALAVILREKFHYDIYPVMVQAALGEPEKKFRF